LIEDENSGLSALKCNLCGYTGITQQAHTHTAEPSSSDVEGEFRNLTSRRKEQLIARCA